MKDFAKKAVKHTTIFGLGDILNRLIGLILLPIYLRYLTPADYGLLELLGVITTLAGMLILQGIPTAAFKGINHTYLNDAEAQKEVVGTSYFYLLLSSVAFFGVCLIFAPHISDLFFSEGDYIYLVRIVFITSFFTTLNNIPFVIFRARLQSIRSVTVSLVTFIVNAGFKIYFVVFLHKGVEGILLGGLITAVMLFIATPALIWKEVKWKISFSKLKPMLAYGWPLIPGAIAGWILIATDRYCLEQFCARSEVGIYSLGFQIAVLVNFVFLWPFQKTWPALFFPIADQDDAPQTIGRFSTYFWGVGLSLSLGTIYMARPLIMIVAPSEYYQAYKIVPILCLSFMLLGFKGIVNSGIFLKNKTKYAPFVEIIGAVLNIILNLALVPVYGMCGASIATCGSSLAMVVSAYYLNRRFYPIRYEFGRILHLFLIFSVFVTVDLVFPYEYFVDAIRWNFPFKNAIFFIVIKCVILVFFPISLFATKLFNMKELKEIEKISNKIPLLGTIIHRFSA